MIFRRRDFLRLAGGAAMLPLVSEFVCAQTYPSRPIRIVVGYAPGGATDILARLIGGWLSRRLGQPVIVENHPGAGSAVAAEMVMRSPADGYTLFLAAAANAINSAIFVHDSAAVAIVAEEPIILSVNPALPPKTIPEFIAYAKKNPGKLSMASPGTGTVPHIAGEFFKMMASVDMVHVPYRGGAQALSDLVAGQVQAAFMGPAASMALVRSGKIRAMAVTSSTRAALLPEVPTIGEFVPGYEATQWFGIVAPKHTPPDIIGKLNKLINEGLADPQVKARLEELGETVVARSSAEFGNRIAADADKWAKVMRTANIKLE
jgi:tripartite-type tricarboxylate transporter receptor subunit TctC